MMTKSEELKQNFVDYVRESSNFYVSVTYSKDKITKITVFSKSDSKKAFTVHCSVSSSMVLGTTFVTNEYIKIGNKISLSPVEGVRFSILLRKASVLIDHLRMIREGVNDDETKN